MEEAKKVLERLKSCIKPEAVEEAVEKLKSSVLPQAEEAKKTLVRLKSSVIEYVEQVPQSSELHD